MTATLAHERRRSRSDRRDLLARAQRKRHMAPVHWGPRDLLRALVELRVRRLLRIRAPRSIARKTRLDRSAATLADRLRRKLRRELTSVEKRILRRFES